MRVFSNGVQHNHPIEAAWALQYRHVSDAARNRLLHLFSYFRSPARALKMYKAELQAEYGARYPTVAADRSIVPDIAYVYR